MKIQRKRLHRPCDAKLLWKHQSRDFWGNWPLVIFGAPEYTLSYFEDESYTTQKVPVFGVTLVRSFPHSDWTRREREYPSIFIPSTRKYGPEKLWIRTRYYTMLRSRKFHFDWLISLTTTANKCFLAQSPIFHKILTENFPVKVCLPKKCWRLFWSNV